MKKSLMERNKIKHFLVYENRCPLNHTLPHAVLLGICKPPALLHYSKEKHKADVNVEEGPASHTTFLLCKQWLLSVE